MTRTIRILPLALLMFSGCPKADPGPARPRPERRAAAVRPAPPKVQLSALLKELAQRNGTTIDLRKLLSRYLPAVQARAMAQTASVTVLKVADDDGKLMGAFLEVRAAPPKRCDPPADGAAKVYWLAEQVGTSGGQALSATRVRTQMFWGKKPAPEVELPTMTVSVPVFSVKAALEGDAMCTRQARQYHSVELLEVYTVVRGRLRQILSVHSEQTPSVAGAMISKRAETKWLERDSERLYMAVVRRFTRSVPTHAAPGPGNSGGMLHHCTRTVTVYEIAPTGAALKWSAATLKKKRKSAPWRFIVPEDKVSKMENDCEGD